jgi:outer membrane protein TolC
MPTRVLHDWQEAYRLLASRSTSLQTALAEVLRADAASRSALSALLPQVSATGVFTHQMLTRTYPILDADPVTGLPTTRDISLPQSGIFGLGVSLSQPLISAAALHNYGTSRESVVASKLSLEDVKRTLVLAAANAIVAVVTAERVAELNRVGLRQALERLSLTKRKQELGAANGLDVIRVEQDVAVARATLITGDESLRQSREALGLALGVAEQVGVVPEIALDSLVESAKSVCSPAASLDQRADIAAARQRVKVADRNANNVTLQFLPTLGLQSGLSTTTADVGAQLRTTWNIQGVLAMPIWDGGLKYGNQRSSRAVAEQSRQSLESARRTAIVQVAQAKRSVAVAESSLGVSSTARTLARETDRLTRLAFQEGRGTSLELVTAATSLRQAEITMALREFDVVRAKVAAMLTMANCSL